MATSEGNTDGVECPTCGRDDFASERGVEYHHSVAHGESISGIEVECAWCGTSKTVRKHRYETYDNHFCDPACRGKHRTAGGVSKSEVGELPSGRIPCANCGDTKQVRPSYSQSVENAFCDRECRSEWLSENRSGEDHPNWSRVSVECDACGDEIKRAPSQMAPYEHHFCDRSCKGNWRAEHYQGKANPMYKEGTRSYGEGWNEEKREAIRDRDGRECRLCGCSEPKQIRRFGRRLVVHHKVPAREFDDPVNRNAKDNLVAVCSECHPKAEKMAPLFPVRQ